MRKLLQRYVKAIAMLGPRQVRANPLRYLSVLAETAAPGAARGCGPVADRAAAGSARWRLGHGGTPAGRRADYGAGGDGGVCVRRGAAGGSEVAPRVRAGHASRRPFRECALDRDCSQSASRGGGTRLHLTPTDDPA